MPNRDIKLMLWLDTETTGSDRALDTLLEVGCILTDREGYEYGEFEAVIKPPELTVIASPEVRKMHEDNGLLAAVNGPGARSLAAVQRALIAWLRATLDREHIDFRKVQGRIILSGSGVAHFDLPFLEREMPEFRQWLWYPVVDVGIFRRVLWYAGRDDLVPELPSGKPHRALADARLHLDEYRTYLALVRNIPDEPLRDPTPAETDSGGVSVPCGRCGGSAVTMRAFCPVCDRDPTEAEPGLVPSRSG